MHGRAEGSNVLRMQTELNERGHAVVESLLSVAECRELAALYDDDGRFRSRVVMAKHGFGRGEYRYFAYPLPGMVQSLRTRLYPELASIANEWNARRKFSRLRRIVSQLSPDMKPSRQIFSKRRRSSATGRPHSRS